MEQQKVDMFIMQNQKYFPAEKILYLKEKMNSIDDSKYMLISTMEFKDPTVMLIISLFLGSLGIDRFMLGETGAGVGKLLTCGGCGIWTIVDWFSITKRTKEKNFNQIMTMI